MLHMISDTDLELLRMVADRPGFALPVLPHGHPTRKVLDRCHRWRLLDQDDAGAWTLTADGREVLARNCPEHRHLAPTEEPGAPTAPEEPVVMLEPARQAG
jgi:hypothetical protein